MPKRLRFNGELEKILPAETAEAEGGPAMSLWRNCHRPILPQPWLTCVDEQCIAGSRP